MSLELYREWQKENRTNWKIEIMTGREIAMRPLTDKDTQYKGIDLRTCADCGRDSKVIVRELEGKNIYQPDTWGWCGGCCIGG